MKQLIQITLLALSMLLAACSTGKNAQAQAEAAADANDRLAITYLESGEVSLAKQSALAALQENPNAALTWYTMGYFQEATGQLKEAEKNYKRAIKEEPSNGIAYNNYGTFLCRNGRHREAIKQFLLAAQQTAYLEVADAYENAGLCSLLIPNQESAMNYFKLAIANSPSHETSLLELSKLYLAQGNLVQATQYFKRYESLSPKPSHAADKVAIQLRRLAHSPQKIQELPEPETTLTG